MNQSQQPSESSLESRLERLSVSIAKHVSLSSRVLDDLDRLEKKSRDVEPSVSYSEVTNAINVQGHFGNLTMLYRISLGGLATAILLVIGLWMGMSSNPVLLAQVAESIRKANSYSVDIKMIVSRNGEPTTVLSGKQYWRAPNDMHMEERSITNNTEKRPLQTIDSTTVVFRDKPGIRIDALTKTYTIVPAQQGATSPLMSLEKLDDKKDHASKQLATMVIEGVECQGFEIAMDKVDPDAGGGTMEVWVDMKSRLPALVKLQTNFGMPMEMVMENFVWNQPLGDALFSTSPPVGYKEVAKSDPTTEETESNIEEIRAALKLYAELNQGKYPQVTIVYGDVTLSKLKELGGFANREPGEWLSKDKLYQRIQASGSGWAAINRILADNPDASYRGKDVGPADKNEVLLKWKLEDGFYQIIYGDLRSEKTRR